MKKLKRILGVFVFVMISIILLPNNVNAEETYSNEFKKMLTDGKAVLTGVKPEACVYEKDGEEVDISYYAGLILSQHVDEKKYIVFAYCAPDDGAYGDGTNLNKLRIELYNTETYDGETHDVDAVWKEPEEEVLTKAKTLYDKIKVANKDSHGEFIKKDSYILSDLYLIAYLNTYNELEDVDYDYYLQNYVFNYTKDIINNTNGANIQYKLSIGAGEALVDNAYLFMSVLGQSVALYNGYAIGDKQVAVTQANYLYVDPNAEDFAKAAKERIDAYLGTNTTTVVKGDKLDTLEVYAPDFDNLDSWGHPTQGAYGYNHYDLFDESKLVDDYYYKVTINGNTFNFVLYKGDNNTLVNPTYIGSDIMSDIKITSDDITIPIDTLLTVKDGDSEDIKTKLGTDIYEAYDISLYSNSTEREVKKIDNGKFLVSIPVSSKLEGKILKAVYIKDDGTLEEHEVTIKNGMATFETDHFSTYILTEKKNAGESQQPVAKPEEKNPQTLDNVQVYFVIGTIALIGLVGTGIYLKRRIN